MEAKQKVACPYCAAQGIAMLALLQKVAALNKDNLRYGCDNGHYFVLPKVQ